METLFATPHCSKVSFYWRHVHFRSVQRDVGQSWTLLLASELLLLHQGEEAVLRKHLIQAGPSLHQ